MTLKPIFVRVEPLPRMAANFEPVHPDKGNDSTAGCRSMALPDDIIQPFYQSQET